MSNDATQSSSNSLLSPGQSQHSPTTGLGTPTSTGPTSTSLDASAANSNKRRRVRKACLPCRQRKRKCDAEDPCAMCKNYGYDCVYPEDTSPLASFVARPRKSPKQVHDSILDPPEPSVSITQNTPIILQPHPGSQSMVSMVRPAVPNDRPPPDAGAHDPGKARYVGSHSAFAFPRALGLDFQSKNPPPLHSFGYTFGIRPEEKSEQHADLRTMITEVEVTQYSCLFFKTIGPIFDILEHDDFYTRCRKYYINPSEDFLFGAIIAQIAALGSFLAVEKCHSAELDLVQYAKRILEDPQFTRRPSIDQVVGWEFRTLYLRSTTRPNNAWLSSCQSVHLCEAIGLHDESCVRRLAAEHSNAPLQRYHIEQLRRIFWGAIDTNTIISCEYGRACVVLPHISTEEMQAQTKPNSYMHLQHQLAKACPSTISASGPHLNPEDQKASLYIAISALVATPSSHPFIALTKGDLCFCFYRRLRQQRISITPSYVSKIIAIGEEALESAVQFAKDRRPYWAVLGSVFQFACVLLALDTAASLAKVANAFRALEEVVANINTHMSREALATARLLLRDSMSKKRRELELLQIADGFEVPGSGRVADGMPLVGNGTGAANVHGRLLQDYNARPSPDAELDIDWDQIFNESYNAFFGGSPQFDENGGWAGNQRFGVGHRAD